MVAESASNFYEGVTQKEVEEFYAGKTNPNGSSSCFSGTEFKNCKGQGRS